VERDAPSVLFALASEHLHTRTRCSFAPAGGRSVLALLKERAGCVGVAELRREVERYRQ
jgi:hypothetical protein